MTFNYMQLHSVHGMTVVVVVIRHCCCWTGSQSHLTRPVTLLVQMSQCDFSVAWKYSRHSNTDYYYYYYS